MIPISDNNASEGAATINQPAAHESAMPKKVLIVEDSMIVAIDMADLFEHLGAEPVEKRATVPQAKTTLKHFTPDFAVLGSLSRKILCI